MNNPHPNSIRPVDPACVTGISRVKLVGMLLLVGSVWLTAPCNVQASEPSTAPTLAQKMNPMNWRMPSFRMPDFLVRHDDQERIVKQKNGLVSDVKSTASRSWQRTKETFSPANLNPMNLFAGPTTPPPSADKKPGIFGSLFSPSSPEPPERVATVNEWLGQERPQ